MHTTRRSSRGAARPGAGAPAATSAHLLHRLLLRLAVAACCAAMLAAARQPAGLAGIRHIGGAPQHAGRGAPENTRDAAAGLPLPAAAAGAWLGAARKLEHASGCHKTECMPRCPRCAVPSGKRKGHCRNNGKYYVCVKNWTANMVTQPTPFVEEEDGGAGGEPDGDGWEDEDSEFEGDGEYMIVEFAMVMWETGQPIQD